MMFYTGSRAAYKEWEGSTHKSFSFPESFSFSQIAQRQRIMYGSVNGGRLLTTFLPNSWNFYLQ